MRVLGIVGWEIGKRAVRNLTYETYWRLGSDGRHYNERVNLPKFWGKDVKEEAIRNGFISERDIRQK